MYVDEEGVVSADLKPYYAISEEIDDSPCDFDDWEPVGLSKKELEEHIHDITDPEIEYGLLSPNGTFYWCRFCEHQMMAEAVAHHLVDWIKAEEKSYSKYSHAEDDIVKAGWAVLKFNNKIGDRWLWPDKWTQRQLDAAWDRQMATGDKIPNCLED